MNKANFNMANIITAPDGFRDLEKAIKYLHLMAGNIVSTVETQSIPIPGMLWITTPGIGQTRLLEYTAQSLSEHNSIVTFEGKEKYVEFTFGYCSEESDNPEIKRLIERIRQAAGFRYEYKGIVCVDISEWVGHEDEKHFMTLLEYLRDNSDKWLVILVLMPQDVKETESIEHVISAYLWTRKIVLSIPETIRLVEYVEEGLKRRSLPLTREAKNILMHSVERMRQSKTFYGFYTLDKLCDNIAYEAYSAEKPITTITKDIASRFSANSSYISRAIYKKEKKRVIGFEGGQNER